MPNIATIARPSAQRTFALGLVAATLVAWSGAANAALPPESFSELAKKVSPAVVNIAATQEVQGPAGHMSEMPFEVPEGSPFEKFFKPFGGPKSGGGRDGAEPRRSVGLGSGFIIDSSGYVVTNNHVVDGASEVTVRLGDDSVYSAEIVGTDPQTDLALLKIEADEPLPAVDFGVSDEAEVGDWVLAVGNPFGLGGSVTAGIISARGRNIQAGPYDDFLQIDASINKGNSGGPLFDLDGEVIGVNTAIFSPSGGNVGIGFAIPSDLAETIVAQLKESGSVERGWLGVHIQPVTEEIAVALGLELDEGAMITQVTPDSPAAEAGLVQGDVILSFAGRSVEGPRELARIVADEPAGIEAEVTLWRDGDETRLTVVTGQKPDQLAAVQPESAPDGAYHSSTLDADLAALSPELRAEYGIGDEVDGVLILDVDTGLAIEQGLRPGDVVKKVGQTSVASPQELDSLVQEAKSDEQNAVLFLVNRQGQDLFLGLKLDIA